jgi:hypothetical protein
MISFLTLALKSSLMTPINSSAYGDNLDIKMFNTISYESDNVICVYIYYILFSPLS